MLFNDTILVGEMDEKILLGEQVRIWKWRLWSVWRHNSNNVNVSPSHVQRVLLKLI
jgi:hypothetical protein